MRSNETSEAAAGGPTVFADLQALVAEIPDDTIVSRTFHGDRDFKAILFGFAPGQELSEHTAARPAVLHFLSGRAYVTLGQERFEAQAGTWVHMPAHLSHSIYAQDEVRMLLLLL
jgi:quercetin dioxygenase-like cupin family protein